MAKIMSGYAVDSAVKSISELPDPRKLADHIAYLQEAEELASFLVDELLPDTLRISVEARICLTELCSHLGKNIYTYKTSQVKIAPI